MSPGDYGVPTFQFPQTNPNPQGFGTGQLPDTPASSLGEILNHVPPEPSPLSTDKLSKLNDRHRIICEMELMGKKMYEIAAELGCHYLNVWKVRNDPLYRVYYEERKKQITEQSNVDIADHLKRISGKTMQTLEYLSDHAKSETVKVKAAEALFDRQLPKINKIEKNEHLRFSVQTNELTDAISMFMEAAGISPKQLEGKTEEEIVELMENSQNIWE